ncbi:MAG: hypothetical protein E3J96_02465 [Sulfurovum sp.]|nr:MAG: hypothetical protein E3J96_02465 [Sulfurovum sp.]
MTKTVTIAHGNGGEENNELIKKVFYKHFENDILAKSEDAAVIEDGKLAFTTDSFTVSPLFFPGGDIGKLAVCGTCNDLANEGTFVLAVAKEDEAKALDVLQRTHTTSAIIGTVTGQHKGKVVLNSSWGTKRFLDLPTGELLPRIC